MIEISQGDKAEASTVRSLRKVLVCSVLLGSTEKTFTRCVMDSLPGPSQPPEQSDINVFREYPV